MPHTHQASNFHYCPHGQRGAALMIMLVIMVMGAATVLVSSLNSSGLRIERDKITADALAQAKAALIGYSVSQMPVTDAGFLPLPDIGWIATPEGSAEGTYGIRDISLIGKFPWKSVRIAPVKDSDGECLWYVLSGRFKNSTSTLTLIFNWDTLGQIDMIDPSGNPIISNIAALIVAPASVLDSQNRSLANSALNQCGGNYDARNYLDSYNSADAIAGEVNYFSGSTNNMLASNINNKRFVMTNNNHYNDRFLFVTTDDIFRPIIRRSDFSAQISALMNDPFFLTLIPSNTGKGIGNICSSLASTNQIFCANWLEMLLLTQLSTPSSITIDGSPTAACNRVLIFGGQKIAAQVRLTATDKSDPAKYLEAPNLAAFAVPTAASSDFTGASIFDANTPSADLLKCIS